MNKLPRIVQNELVDGLTLLLYARLSYAPQTLDELKDTLDAWEWILCQHTTDWSDKDEGRIAAAFAEIAPHLEHWPKPCQLIKHLPPRYSKALALPTPNAVECPEDMRKVIAEVNAQIIQKETKDEKFS